MGQYGGTCNPVITNCTFTSNYGDHGGGLYNFGFRSGVCNPTIATCTFKANTAIFGGGIYDKAHDRSSVIYVDGLCSPSYTNCLISGNRATTSNGGGMYVYSGTQGDCLPSLTNCTFSGNYAVGYGGGISAYEYYGVPYGSDVTVTAKNVIVYNNSCGSTPASYGEIYNEGSASIPTFNVSYSDLKINGVIPEGTGNVYVNPLFTTALDPTTSPSTGGQFPFAERFAGDQCRDIFRRSCY
jgi:predicted outer membrane repeat protein